MNTTTPIQERATQISERIVRPTFFGIAKEAGVTPPTPLEEAEAPAQKQDNYSPETYAARLMEHSPLFDHESMFTIPGSAADMAGHDDLAGLHLRKSL